MLIEIKIPSIGESINEATIANILKPSGSYVQESEEILELETDKVNQVLYAPKSGILKLSIAKDQIVKVGELIGSIDTSAVKPDGLAPVSQTPVSQTLVSTTPEPKAQETKKQATQTAPPEIPHARVKTEAFLDSLNEKKPQLIQTPSNDGYSRKKMSSLRKKIATKLVEVKNETAMLTTFNEIDMSAVMKARKDEQEAFLKQFGVKLGFMSFFVKAASLALQEFPIINSMLDGDDILTFSTYDISIAVATEKGLMVPVLRECNLKNFGQIEQEIGSYATKARDGKMSIEDLRGGTFTITNGGTFGSLLSTPIINSPQSAILGMHAIVKRPIAINDEVVVRPMMYVALSYDHRIIDGKEAVQFLVSIKKALEDPTKLLLDLY